MVQVMVVSVATVVLEAMAEDMVEATEGKK